MRNAAPQRSAPGQGADAPLTEIQAQLAALADPAYKAFHAKLMPTVPPQRILGVRTPALRQYAKQLQRRDPAAATAFLRQLPHDYYEENNLHMALLALREKQLPPLLAEVETFLPYIDNWATCDCYVPKLFARFPAEAGQAAARWLQSDQVYTVRFGMVTLLGFVRTAFLPQHLQQVAAAVTQGPCRDEYYVQMAAAWYFSMALAHQWPAALPWIEGARLPVWVHNKAIQKARESRQLTPQQKQQLQSYKRKEGEGTVAHGPTSQPPEGTALPPAAVELSPVPVEAAPALDERLPALNGQMSDQADAAPAPAEATSALPADLCLQTPRLLLRCFAHRDAADLQEILGDAETMRYSEPPYSPEKTRQFLQAFCMEKRGALAAVHRASGKVIGYLLFHPLQADVWELGWFFNRAWWRQGYAYEACARLADYAFGELHAAALTAETADVERSVPLMQKLGMCAAGVEDGLQVYTLTRAAWLAGRQDKVEETKGK